MTDFGEFGKIPKKGIKAKPKKKGKMEATEKIGILIAFFVFIAIMLIAVAVSMY